jgi:hypothetical protein
VELTNFKAPVTPYLDINRILKKRLCDVILQGKREMWTECAVALSGFVAQ